MFPNRTYAYEHQGFPKSGAMPVASIAWSHFLRTEPSKYRLQTRSLPSKYGVVNASSLH
jgi:hypothetical protein